MTLSLVKLEALLGKNELIIRRIFTIGEVCVYIEVQILNQTDIFFLYIPSKYEIPVPKRNLVFKITQLEINEDGSISEDYTKSYDDVDLEKKYEEIDIDLELDVTKHDDVESHLESNYNHPLSLRDLTKNDLKELKETFRQLKRLRLCVQNLKYKICIAFKNYICCIRRDNTFDGFVIKGPSAGSEKKMFISIDLEAFYTTISSVKVDVQTIRSGIHRVLNKNQNKHTKNIQKILENKIDFLESSRNIQEKKEIYLKYMEELQSLLSVLQRVQEVKKKKLLTINSRYQTNSGLKGLHKDIEQSHKTSKLRKNFQKLLLLNKKFWKIFG